MASSILVSFLGALQASVAVLLTILCGVALAQFDLLPMSSARNISRTCMKFFLPALTIYHVGSQINQGVGIRYGIILAYSLIYNVLTLTIGMVVSRLFNMSSWTVAAVTFNNTASVPLLLLQSLDASGALSELLLPKETSTEALDRAKSYFLINAVVGNSLIYALGPRFISSHDEETSDDGSDEDRDAEQLSGSLSGYSWDSSTERNDSVSDDFGDEDEPDEHTTLLPDRLEEQGGRMKQSAENIGKKYWARLPTWTQDTLRLMYQFVNAPMIGAIVGVVIGLTPPIHRAFFGSPENGGFLSAWLTISIKNIGGLFAPLEMIVVGVKLNHAAHLLKKGESVGHLPVMSFLFIAVVRFILWPMVSIVVIWLLASRTTLLGADRILWFSMMMMPVGPSALKLTNVVSFAGFRENEQVNIAKFQTMIYAISPLICFSIMGSLRASEVISS